MVVGTSATTRASRGGAAGSKFAAAASMDELHPQPEEEEEDEDEEQEEEDVDVYEDEPEAGYGEDPVEDDENDGSNMPDETQIVQQFISRIHYSPRYNDDRFEYRHVILPRDYYTKYVPKQFKNRLLDELEWRHLGIQQSPGWVHYELHKPEPHIFLYRRLLSTETAVTGK